MAWRSWLGSPIGAAMATAKVLAPGSAGFGLGGLKYASTPASRPPAPRPQVSAVWSWAGSAEKVEAVEAGSATSSSSTVQDQAGLIVRSSRIPTGPVGGVKIGAGEPGIYRHRQRRLLPP